MIKRMETPTRTERLGRPENGKVTLQLGELSYTFTNKTNIPFNWLDQACLGLRHLMPFNVHGVTEDSTKLYCIVSFYNCHIVKETADYLPSAFTDEEFPLDSHYVNMWYFCLALHDDIRANLDSWTEWVLSCEEYAHIKGTDKTNDFHTIKNQLIEKLELLDSLLGRTTHDFLEGSYLF